MGPIRRLCALVLVAAFAPFALGCSSSYVPAASPRAAIVMDSGSYAYTRDGKKYDGGLFGGDIEEVVRGNPQAEDYARAYKGGMLGGFLLSLAGALGVGAGAAVTVEQGSQRAPGQSVPPTGLVVMGGGLAVEMIGLFLELNALPHMTDAINAYNDGLGAQAAGGR